MVNCILEKKETKESRITTGFLSESTGQRVLFIAGKFKRQREEKNKLTMAGSFVFSTDKS